nr:translation initiation factor IF-2 N-terminal domain-containing protein [Thermoleophilaceae bacterium]
MAKKRVHEIAKERGIPSKEVIARLQAAGFDVKAAASSVDERDIAVAFSGGTREQTAAPQATAAPAAPEARDDGQSPAAEPASNGGPAGQR